MNSRKKRQKTNELSEILGFESDFFHLFYINFFHKNKINEKKSRKTMTKLYLWRGCKILLWSDWSQNLQLFYVCSAIFTWILPLWRHESKIVCCHILWGRKSSSFDGNQRKINMWDQPWRPYTIFCQVWLWRRSIIVTSNFFHTNLWWW